MAKKLELTKPWAPAERATVEAIRQALAEGRIEIAAADKIDRYPTVLEDFMRRFYSLAAGEYAFSDESHLLDDGRASLKAWQRAIKRAYGIDLPDDEGSLFLWMVIELIAKSGGVVRTDSLAGQ